MGHRTHPPDHRPAFSSVAPRRNRPGTISSKPRHRCFPGRFSCRGPFLGCGTAEKRVMPYACCWLGACPRSSSSRSASANAPCTSCPSTRPSPSSPRTACWTWLTATTRSGASALPTFWGSLLVLVGAACWGILFTPYRDLLNVGLVAVSVCALVLGADTLRRAWRTDMRILPALCAGHFCALTILAVSGVFPALNDYKGASDFCRPLRDFAQKAGDYRLYSVGFSREEYVFYARHFHEVALDELLPIPIPGEERHAGHGQAAGHPAPGRPQGRRESVRRLRGRADRRGETSPTRRHTRRPAGCQGRARDRPSL